MADLDEVHRVAAQEMVRLERILDGADASLAGESLCQALRRIVDAHAAMGMMIDVDAPESVETATETLKPEVVNSIVEACHEAATNVLKHAEVRSAKLTVAPTGDGVRISVADRGVGFDPSQPQGFGVTESIQRRIAEVGGEVEIVSALGRGTQVSIWVAQ